MIEESELYDDATQWDLRTLAENHHAESLQVDIHIHPDGPVADVIFIHLQAFLK